MKTIELQGTARDNTGKTDAKHLRRAGHIPCVVYGDNEPKHFYCVKNEIKRTLYTPETFIIKLEVGDAKMNAIIKEAQFHPVTEEVLHVDFLEVQDSTRVKVEIPITLIGTPKGVLDGGRLVQIIRKLGVMGVPSKLPHVIEIDISNLEMGSSFKVHELELEDLTITTMGARAIAAIEIPRSAKEAGIEEDEEEEGEGEEGEEAATE